MDKPIPEAVQISDEMVERACKRYAFREDGATFPDDYSEYEVLAERKLMRDFLTHVLAERLAAAQQPDHIVDATKMGAQQGQVAVVCLVTEKRYPHFAEVQVQLYDDYKPKNGDKLYLAPQPMQQGGGEVCPHTNWDEGGGGYYCSKCEEFMKPYGDEANTAPPSAPVGVIGDAIRHLSKWLDLNDCECESGHQCGRSEVEQTRDQLRALAQQPAAVDGAEVKAQAYKWIAESAKPLKLARITPEEAWRISYEAGYRAATLALATQHQEPTT